MTSATAAAVSPQQSTARKSASFSARLLVFILFFGSGMAGLIYEVVWSRHLTYQFGATLDAVTAILVAFMGGLALGAWLLGKAADRSRRPLALYGKLEIIIGLSALALPLLLEVIAPLYRQIVNSGAVDGFLARRLLRFSLTIFLLLIPTTAMGATLPALSRFLTRSGERLGLNVGGLYALNTLGAVVGAFLSGFFLIPALGVRETMLVAVALNLVAGAIALGLSHELGEADDFASERLVSKAKRRKLAKKARQEKDARQLGAATVSKNGSFIPLADHSTLTAWVYGVSGFVALALQVVWFRALVFNFQILKSTTYAFSAMLTVFLVGIAAGSMLMTPLADRIRRRYLAFGLLEIMIGLCGLFSFVAIAKNFPSIAVEDFFDPGGGMDWGWKPVAYLFSKTGAAILPATLTMGLLFPVAARCYVESVKEIGSDVGRLYACNTVGAIFGAFGATFLVVPLLGVGWAILGLSMVSLTLGAIVIARAAEINPPAKLVLALGPAALGLAAILPQAPGLIQGKPQYPIEFHYMTPVDHMVFYADGPLGTISVDQNPGGHRRIYVDKVGVAGTDPVMLTDQKSLAHVPMLLTPDPKRVLTVGFGSGGASYSFSTYPELEEIHCVEIDPTVPRAAATLMASNWGFVAPKYRLPDGSERVYLPRRVQERLDSEGKTHSKLLPQIWDWLPAERDHRPTPADVQALAAAGQPNVYEDFRAPDEAELMGYFAADPRYRLILDDARDWLQSTETVYDVIATDCTDLSYKTNANLYDEGYFRSCRERISENGLVVVWMPMGGLTDEMYRLALRTFAEVFPKMAVWFMNNEPTHYCLLIGWKGELDINLERMERRLAHEAVNRDLAELFLNSSEKILSCYLADYRTLRPWLGDGPLNTENQPILEFEAPKFLISGKEGQLADNLEGMADRRNNVMDYVSGSPRALAAMRAKLERYEAAEPYIILGHKLYRDSIGMEEFTKSQQAYLKALELCPEDKAISNLLAFNEIKSYADKGNQPFHQLQLGRLYNLQGRDGDALHYLLTLANRAPSPKLDPDQRAVFIGWQVQALEAAAEIYAKNGQEDRAADMRARVRALSEE